MTSPQKSVYLIDGSAYAHRAFHAVHSLANSKGLPTNAVFGFTRMLLKLIEDYEPEYIGILFDAKGPTFRHEMYKDYKANRPPMPPDLALQLPYIKEMIAGFNLRVREMQGYEADDLIGTLALEAEKAGFSVVMVTGDKDFMQLLTEAVTIWDPMKEKTIDVKSLKAEMGVTPAQLIDVMGLSGDTADNIPGVPGVGQKTALRLIQTFENLENLYAHVDEVPQNKLRENLKTYQEQAFLSRTLATIKTDVPIPFEPEAFKRPAPDTQVLGELFKTLEFRQLQKAFAPETKAPAKDYRTILSESDLDDLIARLKAAETIALDTETTSQDPMQADLVGLSFAVKPHEAFYIPCGHNYLGAPSQLDRAAVLARLKPLLKNPAVKKVGQNIKYDWIVLKRHGVDLEGVAFDTMLASYLLNPSKRAHNLDQIAIDFLGHKTTTYKEVTGKSKERLGFNQVPIETAAPYACEDADITRMSWELLSAKLAEVGLDELLAQVEMPLVPVLMRMEMRGISIDEKRLRALSQNFENRLREIEKEIYAAAGEKFNIRSSQQLGQILFEKLKLPVQKKTRKKTGYSTDVDVLTTLAGQHELPALILRHRTLAKLKSTYTDALLGLVHPDTGRIHTSYNQTVTATGRLSSSDPNLQNIPIRTPEGRKIRAAFIPQPGWDLLSADYSQIELRILAHYADDPILIKAFLDDEDIHMRTACEVFQVPPAAVTPELRRQAKIINFGIIYGMSPFGLSKELGISQKMAKTYIDHYFAHYRGVKAFIKDTIEDARAQHQTCTLMGRIRLLPEIDSPNTSIRQFAERTAINTPIQGTAADLIKLAMIRVDEVLQEKRLEAGMLLSVHDELVFEVPPHETETLQGVVKAAMEGVWQLKVPLKVNIATGRNWAAAH